MLLALRFGLLVRGLLGQAQRQKLDWKNMMAAALKNTVSSYVLTYFFDNKTAYQTRLLARYTDAGVHKFAGSSAETFVKQWDCASDTTDAQSFKVF